MGELYGQWVITVTILNMKQITMITIQIRKPTGYDQLYCQTLQFDLYCI